MPKKHLEDDFSHIPNVAYVSPLELKPNRVLIGLGVATIIIALGTLGYLLVDKLFLGESATAVPNIEITKKPLVTKVATPGAQKDETADWKEHINQKAGFSIKYPPYGKLTNVIDNKGIGIVEIDLVKINSKITIAVKDQETAEALLGSFKSCSEKGEVSSTTIDGVKVKKCVLKSSDGTTVVILFDDFTKNGQVIYDAALVKLRPSEQNLEGAKYFDQILSTFQFLD